MGMIDVCAHTQYDFHVCECAEYVCQPYYECRRADSKEEG